ncbi:hypothetical protein HMN09_01136700 [Mycena chlorophos]|uniref:Uncharacterized protein n=1 Tax=Mycena chlorophos TaxID=658473 RepID=A0A8H6SBI3_MYCCL|nr:hypothetical protein HMN09_01136700 [Mycena chlorophos]
MPPTMSSETILRPRNASKTTIKELRRLLGYDRRRWIALRTCVRFAVLAADLDNNAVWKAQHHEKVAIVAEIVHVDFPETKCFEAAWGLELLARRSFRSQKSYRRCVDDPSTYHGGQADARRRSSELERVLPARRRPLAPYDDDGEDV